MYQWKEMEFSDQTVKRVGLIVIEQDAISETRLASVFSSVTGATLHVARVPSGELESPNQCKAYLEQLTAAAGSLLPGEDFAVVGFSCSTGAMRVGEEELKKKLGTVKSGAEIISPLETIRRACSSLSVKRVALITPYTVELSSDVRTELEARGLTIAEHVNLPVRDEEISSISFATLEAAARYACVGGVDGLIIACTGIQVLDRIAELEGQIGIPVITSLQSFCWGMLKAVDVHLNIPCYGRLFS